MLRNAQYSVEKNKNNMSRTDLNDPGMATWVLAYHCKSNWSQMPEDNGIWFRVLKHATGERGSHKDTTRKKQEERMNASELAYLFSHLFNLLAKDYIN